MAPPRVLHLVGSPTSDFFADLSRLYARDCLRATADPALQAPVIAYVTPDRRWRFPAALDGAALDAAEAVDAGEAIRRIAELGPDAMVPQMFCLAGMTDYRALFDVLGIPYIGNRPATMALGADKARAKAVVADAGVDTPAAELLGPGDDATLAPPIVVKPVDADNSAGVSLVRAPAQLAAARRRAGEHSRAALVEEYVELGREVRAGIIERDGELWCLPLEEYAVDPDAKPIRGAEDKLARDGAGELGLTAKVASRAWIVETDDPVCEPVWDAARRAHRALGCRDYSLFDFRIDPAGRPWFLEAGLYCSYAEQSVLCTMARAAGAGPRELLALGLANARARAGAGPPR